MVIDIVSCSETKQRKYDSQLFSHSAHRAPHWSDKLVFMKLPKSRQVPLNLISFSGK